MNTVHFPSIGSALDCSPLSVELLTDLAPQVDRFLRADRIGPLSCLLDQCEIPRQVQPETIRQSAVGYSLFRAFDGYARHLRGEKRSRYLPPSIEAIERAASRV